MKKNYYSFNYNNNMLMAVPAMHYHSVFAEQINRMCRDPKLRPDAIAVELGHEVVLELKQFLLDLKQGTSQKVILPCMLGLLKSNKYLHSDNIGKALLLQELYRSPLSKLPNDVLLEHLNYCSKSTIFISPADSIIESIRCAIELDIPIYGVDLIDFANTNHAHHNFEDPQMANKNLMEYENRVMKYCDAGRDIRIDFNRENFMVSGLKYCLTKHNKVLFTCGMAHWKSIFSMLNDDKVLPFPVQDITEKHEFCRVIVHPSLAVSMMEIMPQITFDYERRRYPVCSIKKKLKTLNPEVSIRKCLDNVYNEYNSSSGFDLLIKSDSINWSKITLFEQFLFQFSTIRQKVIPDFGTLLTAAEAMMDDKFCRIMTKKIMEVKPNWASKNDFPDLPVIQLVTKDIRNSSSVDNCRKIRLSSKINGEPIESDFYTTTHKTIDIPDINKYWEWIQPEKDKMPSSQYGNPWIWPPCECLIYGLAFKAAEIALLKQRHIKLSSAFEGSLEGGIDTKATLRSIIRGENKVYVSSIISGQEKSILDGINPDPFVLIFPESSDLSSGKWGFFTGGSDLESFVSDAEKYNKISTEKGRIIVSSISLEHKIEAPKHLQVMETEMTKTHGTVMFGNPCINARQTACWMESTGYQCCPIIYEHDLYSLLEYYQNTFNLNVNLDDWQESLIRMAIPYAKKMVTIVAPDSFQLPAQAKIEAVRKRITLNLVGYSNFSLSQLEEARHRISIPTLDRSGIQFPPEAESLIGQTIETYFEMLPPEMRKQVGFNINIKDDAINRL